METYRGLNQQLVGHNQELRKEVARLKDEIIALNAQLMIEKQKSQRLGRHYYQFISKITQSSTDAIVEFNKIIEGKSPNKSLNVTNNTPPIENRQSSRSARRSLHRLQQSLHEFRPVNNNLSHCDKENQNPENDASVDHQPQVSYVQTRRRRPVDVPTPDEEPTVVPDPIPFNFSAIAEECTQNSNQSQASNSQNTIRSIITENSLERSDTNRLLQILENENRALNSLTLEDSSSSSQNLALPEDTIFSNFQGLKAISSTPKLRKYKIRECFIQLERLSESEIARWASKGRQRKTRSKKQRQVNAVQKRAGRNPSITATENRPKRNAAPASLTEPKLNKKLRRSK